MAPVVRALGRPPHESVVCVTAQHRDMLDQVLDIFELHAEHDLEIMTPGSLPTGHRAACWSACRRSSPRSDPTSSWSRATRRRRSPRRSPHISSDPVGHVEAGLRTGNRYQSVPRGDEPRADHAARRLHFAPTAGPRPPAAEGVPAESLLTGNTVIDALSRPSARTTASARPRSPRSTPRRIMLVTTHRRRASARRSSPPARPSGSRWTASPTSRSSAGAPQSATSRRTVEAILCDHARVHLIDPLDYVEFVHLWPGRT